MVKTDLVKTISLVASFGLACFPGLKTHIFEKGFQSGDFPLCRRVARELGEDMSDEELRAMIDEFDTDGDGESEWDGLAHQSVLHLVCSSMNSNS